MARKLTVTALLAGAAALCASLTACGDRSEDTPRAERTPGAAQQSYLIGVIGKSDSNPVFKAARAGAEAAARDLSREHGIEVRVRWQTPSDEDAQRQAQFVEQLAAQGVDGIAISVSDANVLASALRGAVDRGVTVVTFDADAPDSGRMAYYGVDDREAGRAVMRELAAAMGGEGLVAVLAGNQAAANLQARVAGVRDEAANHEGIRILDVFYHPEQATDAVAQMQRVQTANPEISGWALVGGWPLYTDNALDGIHQNARVVSMDPLPLPLEYLKSGQVQVLIGQPYFDWGYESVRMIVEAVHLGQRPESEMVHAEFDIVTQENAEEYAGRWDEWLR